MRVFTGWLLALLLVSAARTATLPVGRVIDRVECAADSSQAYALYVPSQYAPTRRWPVIFCFDAGARGRVPVERLQAVAEKYGYIVAGSLNSRNGLWANNAKAIEAMARDVETHWAIDPKRTYTAGMSGGARVATAVAMTGFAQGVIACSAGFPESDRVPGKVPFAFFGTAGREDFNYTEMRRLDEELAARHAAHRVVFFPGGHEWASVELLTAGVEWLELQAMRTGTRAKDDAFIAAQLAARQTALPAETGAERWRGLQAIVADFASLTDTAALAAEVRTLEGTRLVKDQLKAERQLVEEESRWASRLVAAAESSVAKKQKLADGLRALVDAKEDSPTRAMARRAMANQASITREAVRDYFTNHDYANAVGLLEMAAVLRPGQSRTLFDLARAEAGSGERKAALATLDRAAAAGFADVARLESEPLFKKLRTDPGYAAILARVRANPPEPEGRRWQQ